MPYLRFYWPYSHTQQTTFPLEMKMVNAWPIQMNGTGKEVLDFRGQDISNEYRTVHTVNIPIGMRCNRSIFKINLRTFYEGVTTTTRVMIIGWRAKTSIKYVNYTRLFEEFNRFATTLIWCTHCALCLLQYCLSTTSSDTDHFTKVTEFDLQLLAFFYICSSLSVI